MNNTEHGKEDIKTFFSGANTDKEKEFLGGVNEGEYIDGRNQVPVSVNGSMGSSVKIDGETVLYPNTNLSANYICLGSHEVNGRKVEYWASTVGGENPAIRIDGDVMVQSANLTFDVKYPLQFDKNESCQEGEVFLTDNNSIPLIFDLKDIIDNFTGATQKYFSQFNISQYQINLSTPLDIPVFIDLVSAGGGGGLPVGEYAYSIRYVNAAGDRTNWGNMTPLIPVFQSAGTGSTQYPYVKTVGSDHNVTLKTAYGPKLRFRVTNLLNYDSLEIRRLRWDAGNLSLVPTAEIVGRIGLAAGEISIKEFIDPTDSNVNEVIPDDEDVNQLFFIEKAKAIRYFDKRLVLMHYSNADKSMNGVTFDTIGGKEMFPIVQKIGKAGHNDPYNHTYYKHYQSGEKYGFAINGFDGAAEKGFALGITNFNNYQFPNRRQEMTSDEELYSYDGAVTAANLTGTVSKTFEVFDLVDAVQKSDVDTFKNIMEDNNTVTAEASKGDTDVMFDSSVDPSTLGANYISVLDRWSAPYSPYRPTSQNDSTAGHNYRVNTYVQDGNNQESYNPKGYAPDYYAKGIALSGVTGLPDWVKAFNVVRTKKAGRVVCQGLGMYSLIEKNTSGFAAEKDRDKLWFFSQDIASGLVNNSVLDDINANPQNYSVQFVSPLGFFSEMYNNVYEGGADGSAVDMAVYARVLKDAGEINPTESGVGVNDYVAFNKYRNYNHNASGSAFAGSGDTIFPILSLNSKTEGGRGSSYFELSLNGVDIYNDHNTALQQEFSENGLKKFHEPFYIVNIIQTGANISDQNIDNYLNTGTYVKVESLIGEGDGVTNDPTYLLVDERWEDCIPSLSSGSSLASNNKFIYLKDSNGTEQAWLNVSYKTPAQINTISNNIITNTFDTIGGVKIYGLYTHTQSSNNREFTLVFNVANFNTVPAGTKIYVKYDNSYPIRVFGGDNFIGESIFSPIDREATGEDTSTETDKQFELQIGFPFFRYFITPRHYVVVNTKGLNRIQDSILFGSKNTGRLSFIRQMAVMFAAENRIALHTAYSTTYPNQFFPGIHYVMRPNKFDDGEFSNGATAVYADNNIYAAYEDDYGDEYLNWKYGGIRYLPQHNVDYSQESPLEFVSKPDFGYTEQNEFCTGITWSLARAVNQQDSPGLKTFQSLNTFFISDDQGGIQRAWDATSGKGDNLYAITSKGVCLLLTNKSVLTDLSGSQLGVFKGNNFIQEEYWLDKTVGMNDEMWRTAAETSVALKTQDGSMVQVESLFWANRSSVYWLSDNAIRDIGRDGYYNKLRLPLNNIKTLDANLPLFGQDLTGFYDKRHEVYGVQLQHNDSLVQGNVNNVKELFVYSPNNKSWMGTFDYRFDSYTQQGSNLYGMRDGESYELYKGTQINGANITYSIDQACSPIQIREKEFMNININSTNKPTRVEFYDENMVLQCAMAQSIQGNLYLKDYDGWQQQIPRKDVSVSATRDRLQGRLVIYRIIHNLAESFKLISVNTEYKILK
jgi:hypothetical protein